MKSKEQVAQRLQDEISHWERVLLSNVIPSDKEKLTRYVDNLKNGKGFVWMSDSKYYDIDGNEIKK